MNLGVGIIKVDVVSEYVRIVYILAWRDFFEDLLLPTG